MSWAYTFSKLILATYVVSTLLRKLFGLYLIGLSGGIGCGKSTFIRFVKDRTKTLSSSEKPHVIDLDDVSRQVVKIGSPGLADLKAAFGEKILNKKTKELDRDKLGREVFGDKAKLEKLNSTMTKYIVQSLIEQVITCFFVARETSYIILDAPLLFETKLNLICSESVCIVASELEQLKRVLKRNRKLDRKQVKQRISSQMPTADKAALATYVIENTGKVTERELGKKAEQWWKSHQIERERFWIPTKISLGLAVIIVIPVMFIASFFI